MIDAPVQLTPRQAVLPLAAMVALYAIAFALHVLRQPGMDPRGASLLGLGSLAIFSLSLIALQPINLVGPGSMVLAYFLIVSFGLPLAFLVNAERLMTVVSTSKFVSGTHYGDYIALAMLAQWSWLLGSVSGAGRSPAANVNARTPHTAQDEPLATLGILLAGCFSIYLVHSLASGAMPVDYLAFKAWSNSTLFTYLRYGFWFGAIFAASVGSGRQILHFGNASLPAVAVLAFTGNRNDFLYVVLLALGMYAMRFHRIPRVGLAVAVLFLLLVSPTIASTRSSGVDLSTGPPPVQDALFDSLVEFGSELRPVSLMFTWLEDGEPHAMGATYIYPSAAIALGVASPVSTSEYLDSRFALESRIATQGFTMPGELYFNFGAPGVLAAFFAIGRYMARKETAELPANERIVYGFWIFMLLHWQRNEFSFSIWTALVFAALYLTATAACDSLEASRVVKPTSGPTPEVIEMPRLRTADHLPPDPQGNPSEGP